ncbi:F-box protein At1g55000-like [Phalaenopsis equestris]|uniref:F-box protein At1g55000-like n=1 Tax=Phalaenopsis equestris TaxID=78828 RepID=UPI0009E59D39|nr:F-box protein At1g55000-like [Phalaenopsis equestris]
MGCCGEDEEDGLLHTLLHDPNPNSNSSPEPPESVSTSAESVLSPLKSNFSALGTSDLLRSILGLLPSSDLARAACVCRVWREVASEGEVRERAFRKPWNVRRLIGSPSSPGFWRYPGLDKFAISHRVLRGDTVAGVALKYAVQVMDIKRLNNMMSDHGIYSRERLLIPIRNPELLQDSICYIELDVHAKREVAVLYLEGGLDGNSTPFLSGFITERGRKIIIDSMKRSMHVDDETAAYYLSISNNNPRAAFLEFSEDLRWEHRL